MKNFFLSILSILAISVSFYGWLFAAWCDFDPTASSSAKKALEECLNGTSVVPVDNVDLATGFQTVIVWWVNNIAILLGILAVWSIVFGSLLLTLSTWEDEKIKKAKDVIKWWILGFLGVVTASTIVTIVVKIMYSI